MQMELQSADYEGWTDDLWFYIIFYVQYNSQVRKTAGNCGKGRN